MKRPLLIVTISYILWIIIGLYFKQSLLLILLAGITGIVFWKIIKKKKIVIIAICIVPCLLSCQQTNNLNNKYNKIYKLMKDNDYINIMGCFLEYKEISSRFDSYNPKEFAGCYNGWLLWKKKKTSVEYVDIFLDAYYNII